MRLSIDLDPAIHQGLRMTAARNGTTVSSIVRSIIESYLAGGVGGTIEKSHQEGKVRVIDKIKVHEMSVTSPPIDVGGATNEIRRVDAVAKTKVEPSKAKRPMPDFSKGAQSKGRMGR